MYDVISCINYLIAIGWHPLLDDVTVVVDDLAALLNPNVLECFRSLFARELNALQDFFHRKWHYCAQVRDVNESQIAVPARGETRLIARWLVTL